MKKNTLPLLICALLGACQEFKTYESGGFGSINGGAIDNTTSNVTISGRVMSSATYQAYSSSLLSMRVDAIRSLQGLSNGRDTRKSGHGTVLAVVANDCADGAWSLSYVGGGTGVRTSGTADSDGAFEVPAIPEGKEGLITFTCGSSTQKCLVKAGDVGLACNAVADGVVGALEASFGTALTSTTFSGKTIAKVASSIVEATNSDSADAETLKTAIEACKSIAAGSSRNTCYKNSLDSSDQAGVLEVAKTLAQTWSARGLFNFVIGTAGYKLYMDSLLYTDFGARMDEWLDTDFVAQARAYVSDLVNNPVYVGGVAANGEHIVKIVCQTWYNKYRSGGTASYPPAIVAGVPNCYNWPEISKLTGITDENHAAIQAMEAGIAADADNVQYQVGLPGDMNNDGDVLDAGEAYVDFNRDSDNNPSTGEETNCPNGGSGFDTPGNFCVGLPSQMVVAKNSEPNRNDVGGLNFSEEQASVALIEVFEPVKTKISLMHTASVPAGPLQGCVVASGGTPTFDTASAVCLAYVRTEFTALRRDFSGMLGLYMYLRDPSSYSTGGTSKLSLNDIHRIVTKKDFFNARYTFEGGGDYGGKNVDGTFYVPPILAVNGAALENSNVFLSSAGANITQATYDTVLANSSLLGEFTRVFGGYLTTETTSQLQARIQSSSHHEPWNPYGSKSSHVPAMKLDVSGTPTLFPIYCRMRNRKKLDSNSGPLPMSGQLNPNALIDCLADPVAAGVGSSSEGVYTYPANFAYPFVLQFRGDSGDSKGKLFALADRKTGQSMYFGGAEVFVLESSAGNGATFVVSGSCGGGFSEPSLASNAPLVQAKVSYGQGDYAKEEVVSAYCLNMGNVLTADTNTRLYMGSIIEVANNDGSKYQVATLGARYPGANGISDVCLFGHASLVSMSATGAYTLGGGYVSTDTYTNSWGSYSRITDFTTGSAVDKCDATSYSTKTKYFLTHFYDNNNFDATDGADILGTLTERGDKPVGLIRESDGAQIHGVLVSIRALEAELGAGVTVANSGGVTWAESLKLVNTKHDAKFDPFCDDRGTAALPALAGNGKCDCYEGNTTSVKAGTCTLGDTPIEPTMSEPPYPWGGNEAAYIAFFATYGGLEGAALVDGGTPLSFNWLQGQTPSLMMSDAILSCKYLVTSETTYRRPSRPWGMPFNSLNFEGCPDATGVINNPTSFTGQVPDDGGGPMRLVKPEKMNNAYDIGRPKQYAALMSYAMKTVGQGNTLSATDKVFTYDEALALIAARMMLPEKIQVNDHSGNPISGRASLRNVRMSDDQDISVIGALLKGITKPADLALPD